MQKILLLLLLFFLILTKKINNTLKRQLYCDQEENFPCDLLPAIDIIQHSIILLLDMQRKVGFWIIFTLFHWYQSLILWWIRSYGWVCFIKKHEFYILIDNLWNVWFGGCWFYVLKYFNCYINSGIDRNRNGVRFRLHEP